MKNSICLFYDLVHKTPMVRKYLRKYLFSQIGLDFVEHGNDIRWPLTARHAAVCHYKLTDIKARYGRINVIKYGLDDNRFRYIHYMDGI